MEIQQLHTLIDTNVTQQNPSDRIAGAEVRQVDHAITDEVAARGIVNGVSTDDLDLYTRGETGHVLIPNQGVLIPLQSDNPPDNITTFPSGEAGWLWQKAVTFVRINPAGNNVVLGSNKYKFIIDDLSNKITITKPADPAAEYMQLDLANENYTIGRSEGYTRMVLHGTNGMHISAYNATTTTAVGVTSIISDVVRPTMYMMMSVPAAATDARVAMFLTVASVQSHLTIRNKKLSFHVHDATANPQDVNYLIIDPTPGANVFQFGDTTNNESGMLLEFQDNVIGMTKMHFKTWGSRCLGWDDQISSSYLGDIDSEMSGLLLTVEQNSVGMRLHHYGVLKLEYEAGTGFFNINCPLKVTDPSGHLMQTGAALVGAAGALAGTLNNAPAAGDPTKWISINDAGVIRRIPTW